MKVQQTEVSSDRIVTVPNALSALRLAGVPLFLWLVLGPHEDGWAVAVLALAGLTDWLDGYLARRTGQITRLGQLLDRGAPPPHGPDPRPAVAHRDRAPLGAGRAARP